MIRDARAHEHKIKLIGCLDVSFSVVDTEYSATEGRPVSDNFHVIWFASKQYRLKITEVSCIEPTRSCNWVDVADASMKPQTAAASDYYVVSCICAANLQP
jgi:hypothetical protein